MKKRKEQEPTKELFKSWVAARGAEKCKDLPDKEFQPLMDQFKEYWDSFSPGAFDRWDKSPTSSPSRPAAVRPVAPYVAPPVSKSTKAYIAALRVLRTIGLNSAYFSEDLTRHLARTIEEAME